jgi:G3E family GTPase
MPRVPVQRIPVSLITGFLGSGKTTVLNHLLHQDAFRDAAVLINELGEIAIDHSLVRNVDENVLRLATGCLCCAMRGDMIGTLRDLYAKRCRGQVPEFRRMLIETTGLADPAPVLHTLMRDPLIAEQFRLDGVIVTVDAVNGADQLHRQRESIKQAAVADRLLLTKTDIAAPGMADELKKRLREINPSAPIIEVLHGRVPTEAVLDAGLYDSATKSVDVRRWLAAESYSQVPISASRGLRLASARHGDDVSAFCVRWTGAVEWHCFADAMHALVDAHGKDLLRVKGIIEVVGERAPVVVHGVQHLFHPPVMLPAWPDADQSSRLVFITRGIEDDVVRRKLACVVPAVGESHS